MLKEMKIIHSKIMSGRKDKPNFTKVVIKRHSWLEIKMLKMMSTKTLNKEDYI